MNPMMNDDCPLCRLDAFVEQQRREGRRKGWSSSQIVNQWDEALFRRARCDWRRDRELAEKMLRAGPPQYIELGLSSGSAPLN